MRMYLGHICTVVLLPSCHPHCLLYLAFMYCRTKYLSPVNLSPCKGDAASFFLSLIYYDLFVSLALQWHRISVSSSCLCCLCPLSVCSMFSIFGSAFMTLCFCSVKKVKSVWFSVSVCPISHVALYAFILKNRFMRVYIQTPPWLLCALDLFALSLIKLAFL